MWAITEIINNITKIIASHFAIVSETPEINPNPNIPATIANIKNIIAQINQLVVPLLFIFSSNFDLIKIFDLRKNIIFHLLFYHLSSVEHLHDKLSS